MNWILTIAFCVLVFLSGSPGETADQKWETAIVNGSLELPSAPRTGDTCELFKHTPNDTLIGFSSTIIESTSTVTYYDPTVCNVVNYPFQITKVSFPLFAQPTWNWPVQLDIIIYTPGLIGGPCFEPFTEVARYSINADSAQFRYPHVGEFVLPDTVCIDSWFFVGVEYTDPGPGPYPSIMFDVEQTHDTCDVWEQFNGNWYTWDDWWSGFGPGYPWFWIYGLPASTACCVDADTDGICDALDNCPGLANPTQEDVDADGIGDVCDVCPLDKYNDVDGDGVCGDIDNCPGIANPLQEDTNSNSVGDACEACCLGITGNINFDPLDDIDITDLTYLVDFLFVSGPPPPCPDEANLDGISAPLPTDISDLTFLVDYIFGGGPAPVACP